MKLGTWFKRGLLVALLAIGSWYGLILTLLTQEPWVAIQAFTNDVYPRIPASFAGAYLRWAPYDPNTKVLDTQPLLHFACASYGLVGSDRDRSILVIRMLVAKGANVDSRFKGKTSLHEAILYSISDQDTELVRTLLELGANPELKILHPGDPVNDLTAIEFANFLARKHPAEMQPVIELLRKSAI